ncbi:MAG: hypothetical protein ABFS24_06955 [Pseudomonadota bacterium]
MLINRVVMRNPDATPQKTNMDELIDGIQILFGADALSSEGRKAAVCLIDELAEFRSEKGLNILRALARGEIAAANI